MTTNRQQLSDTLFNIGERMVNQNRPLAHTGDLQTSYDAGQKMLDSGKLSDQEYEVWLAIQEHCKKKNFTAKELSEKSGLNYYTIQRRLNDLRHKGKIKHVCYRENLTAKHYVLKNDRRDGCCVYSIVMGE